MSIIRLSVGTLVRVRDSKIATLKLGYTRLRITLINEPGLYAQLEKSSV